MSDLVLKKLILEVTVIIFKILIFKKYLIRNCYLLLAYISNKLSAFKLLFLQLSSRLK